MAHCHSAHRCARITCPTCTWRHALRQTRRILAISTGPLHTITLTTPNLSFSTIPITRVQLRNAIDHLRRHSSLWRGFSLHLWLTRSGKLEGIASLGTLGTQEVTEKLRLRWPMTLRPIIAEDLRVEVYRTLQRVWVEEGLGRGYQPFALYVGPRRMRAAPKCQNVLTWQGPDEPMPMFVG
jgi:hypothetical protein